VRDDRERLLDMKEAIERIEKYATQGRKIFDADELVQTWTVHHLQIIGEAARTLSLELTDQHAEVPWSKIIGMRNVLVHHYFGIDKEIVWDAIENELPALKAAIDGMLADMPGE